LKAGKGKGCAALLNGNFRAGVINFPRLMGRCFKTTIYFIESPVLLTFKAD
jgi:hypothetical protein